jgi:protein-S-isoprenylcysteine O-methyltransferase Ste14
MYAVASFLFLGIPVALGSAWGALAFAAMVPILIWRLLDEERYLGAHLPGYTAYAQRARWRLFPGVF